LIIEGRGSKENIDSRVRSIQNMIESEESEFAKDELRKRLSRF